MLKNLKDGNTAEQELCDYLNSIGIPSKKSEVKGKFYDYDVITSFDTNNYTFEVKNDIMSGKTGNVAIEFYNSKSKTPSGILVTKADFWVHKVCSIFYICRTIELLDLINIVKPKKVIRSGGDKNSDMLIYRKDDIINEMVSLDFIKCIDDLKLLHTSGCKSAKFCS